MNRRLNADALIKNTDPWHTDKWLKSENTSSLKIFLGEKKWKTITFQCNYPNFLGKSHIELPYQCYWKPLNLPTWTFFENLQTSHVKVGVDS